MRRVQGTLGTVLSSSLSQLLLVGMRGEIPKGSIVCLKGLSRMAVSRLPSELFDDFRGLFLSLGWRFVSCGKNALEMGGVVPRRSARQSVEA